MTKKFLPLTIADVAGERIAALFNTFSQICVSFSGGKDSTVLLHMVARQARANSRKIID